jgi:hypothetical protein
VTHNYATTVAVDAASTTHPATLDQYLRPLGALLLFPGTGEVMALSEREGDALLQLAWGLLPGGPAAPGANSSGSNAGAPALGNGHPAQPPVLMFLSHAGKGTSSLGLAPLAVRLDGSSPMKHQTSKASTGPQGQTVLRLPPPAPSRSATGFLSLGGAPLLSAAHLDPEGIPFCNLVALRFFNGESRYRGAGFPGDSLIQSLVQFLRSQQPASGAATGMAGQRRGREAAGAVLSMRGKGAALGRSDLEKACDLAARPWLA